MIPTFDLDEKDYRIIPMNWQPTEFYSVTFEGWSFSLDFNDETFNRIVRLVSNTINHIIYLYKDTHAFTQPQFCFNANGTFYVKIGTLENEEYERRLLANKE